MKKAFITGGAGFIGIHAAEHYLKKGYSVHIFDNFSRPGTRNNVNWLKALYPKANLVVQKADIRNYKSLSTIKGSDIVIHLSGQVAVTTSVKNPLVDFETNALGTVNLLENVRLLAPQAIVIYSSTNKVYGGMEQVKISHKNNRYYYDDLPQGIPESQCLDFHSPYGCSKGSADQYVRDYSRIFGLKTVVMRQSCIYGTRQFGLEDQGWVSWLTIASILNKPITVYGNGNQVRDILFVDDLIEAFDLAVTHISKSKGQIYNVGGGPKNTLTLLELFDILKQKLQKKIFYKHSDWRPGDQPIYISDIRKIKKDLGWSPKTNTSKGIDQLIDWTLSNQTQIKKILK